MRKLEAKKGRFRTENHTEQRGRHENTTGTWLNWRKREKEIQWKIVKRRDRGKEEKTWHEIWRDAEQSGSLRRKRYLTIIVSPFFPPVSSMRAFVDTTVVEIKFGRGRGGWTPRDRIKRKKELRLRLDLKKCLAEVRRERDKVGREQQELKEQKPLGFSWHKCMRKAKMRLKRDWNIAFLVYCLHPSLLHSPFQHSHFSYIPLSPWPPLPSPFAFLSSLLLSCQNI